MVTSVTSQNKDGQVTTILSSVPQYTLDQNKKKNNNTYNLWVTAAADPASDELQCFLLDRSHALDERLFGHVLTGAGDGARDVLTHHFVHVQHVEVDTTELRAHTASVLSQCTAGTQSINIVVRYLQTRFQLCITFNMESNPVEIHNSPSF